MKFNVISRETESGRDFERERSIKGEREGMEGERLCLHFCSCPKTVENFCVHASNGYYNGHIFHRVIKQFMIQTGDPTGEDYLTVADLPTCTCRCEDIIQA